MKGAFTVRTCRRCGFILGTRPNLREKDGVCLACVNSANRHKIDFAERQKWLDEFIDKNKGGKYDCAVAVSGGKDSHMIVKRLHDNHKLRNILLITLRDEFTPSHAGRHNLRNISGHFGLDHIILRTNPKEFRRRTLEEFESNLNPLSWFEALIYSRCISVARELGIRIMFYGENSAFEYGETEDLEIFHPLSSDDMKILYLGAIYPYSITDSLNVAKEAGFLGLDSFKDWRRSGSVEDYTQIDSYGYMVHIWLKFVKFGFQRVSDIACRMVREGAMTREQAALHIREKDHLLDETAKRDFCGAIGIDERRFHEALDKHANAQLVRRDINGDYRRIDLIH